MASGVYNIFKAEIMKGTFALLTDEIRVALMTSSHSFNATHTTWSNVSTNEITGATAVGYDTPGFVLASAAVTVDGGTRGKFTGAGITWSTSTITARHIVLHDVTAGNRLICSIDLSTDYISSAGNFQITWDASNGILTIT